MLAAFGIAGFIPFLFAKHEAVKLVCLDVDRWHIADSRIMETGAILANGFEDVQNGFFVKSGQPGCCTDANAFTKQPHNLINLLGFNSQAIQRLRLRKRLAATNTAKTAHNTIFITKIGEMPSFTVTA